MLHVYSFMIVQCPMYHFLSTRCLRLPALVLFAFALVLTGCDSNDDGDNGAPIEGTWEAQTGAFIDTEDGSTIYTEDLEGEFIVIGEDELTSYYDEGACYDEETATYTHLSGDRYRSELFAEETGEGEVEFTMTAEDDVLTLEVLNQDLGEVDVDGEPIVVHVRLTATRTGTDVDDLTPRCN